MTSNPYPKVTLPAPLFTAEAVFPDKQVKHLSLVDYRGSYVLFLFFPGDFSVITLSYYNLIECKRFYNGIVRVSDGAARVQ